MNLTVMTKAVSQLTPEEYKACKSLNLRESGSMKHTLQYQRSLDSTEHFAVMAWTDENVLAGWALVNPSGRTWFYVRKAYRRQGVGSRLLQTAKRMAGEIEVEPWHDNNGESGKFFAKHLDDVYIAPGREHYMPEEVRANVRTKNEVSSNQGFGY